MSSDDVGKKISQLHQELLNAYKKRFMCENGQGVVVKCSPIRKNMRKDFKTLLELKSQVHSQIEAFLLFFFGIYLTLALNRPVKNFSLIHANKKININKAKYTINVFYIFSHKFHKTVKFLI